LLIAEEDNSSPTGIAFTGLDFNDWLLLPLFGRGAPVWFFFRDNRNDCFMIFWI